MLLHWLLRLACFTLCFFTLRAVLLTVHSFLRRLRRCEDASSPPLHGDWRPSRPLRTLVILGSGGHTAEMLSLLQTVDRRVYAPLIYVRANTDRSSEARVDQAEEEARAAATADADGGAARSRKGKSMAASWPAHVHIQIPRSREVGQSYVSSVWTTLRAALYAMRIVLQQKPDVMLCNGPGTGVPLVVAAFLCRVFLFRPCVLVFVESFCRVESLSLTGLLLYPIVDEFVVQWPQLDAHASQQQGGKQAQQPSRRRGWSAVKYIGRLC